MFYRRKIILGLLEIFGGKVAKNRLQNLLFLFTIKQSKPDYDFIPYESGCYSYSLEADIETMAAKGILKESNSEIKNPDKNSYLQQLNPADQKYMKEVKSNFSKMSPEGLMKYIFLNYPFYAVKSEIAKKILNKKELEKVIESVPKQNKIVLFTIGYEGISLEEYLLRLIKNNIKMLVDVRGNPLSMKFGFSKRRLNIYCESIGVQYVHFPELGIKSEQRHELKTQQDYDKLFEQYRKNNLHKTVKSQIEILNLLKLHKRIALTCYEADISRCHSKYIVEALTKLPSFNYEVNNI